jgi:hypothetical protein
MTDFNPSNSNHEALLNEIRTQLKDKKQLKTPDLLDQIHPFTPPQGDTWTEGYLRTMLGKARRLMEEQNEITIEKERTQNQPTIIWIAQSLSE